MKTFLMGDLLDQYEAEQAAKAQVEIAAERAAWDALTQAEKDRISAEREARFADLMEFDADEEDEEDEDEDEDDEEENDE